MPKQVYGWKRFWCPQSGRINLADGGYLYDPDAEWGKVHNPDLVTLEAIADVPCLVLLGEPGTGKSQELENLKVLTENKICDDNQVLGVNLRSCTNLKDDLFKEETFINWLGDTYHLYLFLDSLDEGLLSIPNIATGLIDELKKQKYQNHINRLQLRLACRTFVFPEILQEGLKELWTPIIIAVPSSNQQKDAYLELVKYAYLNASEQAIKTLITLIDKENRKHDYLFAIARFDKCWTSS